MKAHPRFAATTIAALLAAGAFSVSNAVATEPDIAPTVSSEPVSATPPPTSVANDGAMADAADSLVAPSAAVCPNSVTLVVDSLGNQAATGDLQDGVCLSAAGSCTLRAALQETNALNSCNPTGSRRIEVAPGPRARKAAGANTSRCTTCNTPA